nr:PTS sugar transporter subunit IIC [endosymbiont 'TC1' of Trimyema compressum]
MGFAILGYRDNGISSFMTHGIGTPKLQMGNILKKTIIWLPNLILDGILGPISILVFKMETSSIGAGMGSSGLVGQIGHY